MAAHEYDWHALVMAFSASWRKFVLLLHVLTSVGFVGAVAGFLALAITGAVSGNGVIIRAVYIACGLMTWDVIVPLAWASAVIGIVQSLGTPWGLVRYYWVVVKLVLSIIAVVVLMIQTENIGMVAQMALAGQFEGQAGPRSGMILHATGGMAVLVVVTILSIYKPRGMTRIGIRALESTRSA
jgi:hypothetical protein